MGKYDPAPTLAAGLIRSARHKAEMTQAELAAAAGVTQQLISAYETGRMDPTITSLMRLIAATGFEVRWRLVARDYHDETLDRFLESLPASQRAALEEQRRRRAGAARLRRVRGR
jgi:transcriptional regulator with XRE-family HTH domain